MCSTLHLTECVRHTVKNTRWKSEVTFFSNGSTTTYVSPENKFLPQPGTRTLSESFTFTIPLWWNSPNLHPNKHCNPQKNDKDISSSDPISTSEKKTKKVIVRQSVK